MPAGGLWNQSSTWVGGIVPTETDTVIINGIVSLNVNATCQRIEISSQGILQNMVSGSFKLYVTGDCINNGTIRNNGLKLVIYIAGDVEQNGTWTNLHILLNGVSDQNLSCSLPFGCQYLTKSNTAGKLICQTGIEFNNTMIDINNDTLFFTEGDYLKINGGSLDQAKIIKEDDFNDGVLEFEMNDNAVFQKTIITADTIRLKGVVQLQSAPVTFNGTVINEGILQNYNTSSYSVNFNGSCINYGAITKNVFSFNLTLKGSWINFGTWNTSLVTLTGSADQMLQFQTPVKSAQIVNTKSSGQIFAKSHFSLLGTFFNLNSDTLKFVDGNVLVLNGSSLINGAIVAITEEKNSSFELNMENNSLLQQCDIMADTLTLSGTVQIGSPGVILKANVINSGIIQNRVDANGYLSLEGNFINRGTLRDQPGKMLLITIFEDISNHGIWTNDFTFLAGDNNRNIDLGIEFRGANLEVTGNMDTLFAVSDLILFETTMDLDSVILQMPDYSKFYLRNGSLSNCQINSGKLEFDMPGSGTCDNVGFPSVELFGNVTLRNNIEVAGDLTVWGTMGNYPGEDATLNVWQDLMNYGEINDGDGMLSISVHGNVTNNATFNNSQLLLNGTSEQYVELQNGNVIGSELHLESSVGNTFEWFRDTVTLIGNPGFTGANTSLLVFNDTVTSALKGVYQCLTDSGWSRQITFDTIGNFHALDLKVFLEGPFGNSQMNTTLNELDHLPLVQGYEGVPWYFPGEEQVDSIPGINVVDWVLVELKDASDAASADRTTIFERRAAFLLNDGRIVDIDGTSKLIFARNIDQGLFVDIIHRNHINIMSAQPLTLNGNIYSYNFTLDASAAYEDTLKDLGGVFGMYSGDANADNRVDLKDKEGGWHCCSGEKTVYDVKDLNLDGEIDNKDKNDCWFGNLNKMVKYPK